MAMLDARRLAELLATTRDAFPEADAAALEADIVARGRKAVLESRSAAKEFHIQSRFQHMNRNVGFRMANVFIRLFAKAPRGSARPSCSAANADPCRWWQVTMLTR